MGAKQEKRATYRGRTLNLTELAEMREALAAFISKHDEVSAPYRAPEQ
jgi:hypothetical protein